MFMFFFFADDLPIWNKISYIFYINIVINYWSYRSKITIAFQTRRSKYAEQFKEIITFGIHTRVRKIV